MNSKFDIFLSHSSTDKPRVRQLLVAIEATGLRVFFDEKQLHAGVVFTTLVREGNQWHVV